VSATIDKPAHQALSLSDPDLLRVQCRVGNMWCGADSGLAAYVYTRDLAR
jgi:hypothetical protein